MNDCFEASEISYYIQKGYIAPFQPSDFIVDLEF